MSRPRLFALDRPEPSKPGPGPMPGSVLKALDITIGRRVAGMLPGDHRTAALGQGTEFAQVRPYAWGDDVRMIDWNATARVGEPHVRVNVAERAMTAWLLLDCSASMAFGTADRRKADVAEGVALAIAHLTSRRGDGLGVIALEAGGTRAVPPRRGRRGLFGVLQALRDQGEPGPGAMPLGQRLRDAAPLIGRGRLVVIVSDFLAPQTWERQLLDLSARNSLICVEVRDPREDDLPAMGEIVLIDPESGRQLRVNTNRRVRERFAVASQEQRAEIARSIARAGATHVPVSTSGDWLRTLAINLSRRRRIA